MTSFDPLYLDPESCIVKAFLDRSCGSWTSQRRYLFAPALKPTNMVTEFEMTKGVGDKPRYVIDWRGQTEGQMILTLDGLTLERSRDYFGDGANSSVIELIDQDCIVMHTSYNNTRFREEVRLIEGDGYRLRQTVGYNLDTGALVLAGQYFETRL